VLLKLILEIIQKESESAVGSRSGNGGNVFIFIVYSFLIMVYDHILSAASILHTTQYFVTNVLVTSDYTFDILLFSLFVWFVVHTFLFVIKCIY